MGILLWIVFGALVGWIASLIMGTNENQGAFGNIVVGIVGAAIGGLLADFFDWGGVSGFNLPSFLTALAGSIILIGIVKMISDRPRP